MCPRTERKPEGNYHNDWVIKLGPDFCDGSDCCFCYYHSLRKMVVKHLSEKLKR